MVLAVSGNPIQPLPRPNSRFALCLDATLSLHKYSSEGTCLNRGRVKQLYRQTHNTHFSALSSEYSQVSVSRAGSLSGSRPSSDVQSS